MVFELYPDKDCRKKKWILNGEMKIMHRKEAEMGQTGKGKRETMRQWKKNARNEKSGAEEKNPKRQRWKENGRNGGKRTERKGERPTELSSPGWK